jgi:hypothetical protein
VMADGSALAQRGGPRMMGLDASVVSVRDFTPEMRVAGQAVRCALAVPLPADPFEPADVPLAHRKLAIICHDGRVVYLIGNYLPDLDVYEARWPD